MVNFASEMERQGFDDPAADRRRDHLARAHRGQGRPEVRRPGGLGEGRLPLGADRGRRCSPTSAARQLLADVEGRLRLAPRAARRQATTGRWCCPLGATPRAQPPTPDRLGAATRPPRAAARPTGVARAQRLRARRAARLHRLAAVLQRLGDEGQVPRHPQQPGDRARRRASCTTTPRRCSTGWSRSSGCAPTGWSGFSRPTRSATTSRSTPTSPAPRCSTTLHHLRQQGEHRDGVPNRSLADFVAPEGDRPAPTTSAPSR